MGFEDLERLEKVDKGEKKCFQGREHYEQTVIVKE